MMRNDAGDGRMTEKERAALTHELNKLVGGVNPDGSAYIDQDEAFAPEEQPPRPSREKIEAIAQEMADRRTAKLIAARRRS